MATPANLTNAIVRYQDARPALRSALRDSATALAMELATDRDALFVRMDKRWGWCWSNTASPQFAEREAALLADIQSYKEHEEALRMAARVLFGEAA